MSEIVRLSTEFRLAEPDDLKASSSQLRYGQIYVVKDSKGNFSGGLATLNALTDKNEIIHWFKEKRIYVPVCYFDNTLKLEQCNNQKN